MEKNIFGYNQIKINYMILEINKHYFNHAQAMEINVFIFLESSEMDPIRQSRESLQTPTNQLSLSDRSKLPQGVKEPIQTISLPKHSTPLQTPVTSVDTQRQPGQMSQSLFGAYQQVDPWRHEPGLGISNDRSRPIQNSFHEVRIHFKCYTIYFCYNIHLYVIYFSRCYNYQNNLKI